VISAEISWLDTEKLQETKLESEGCGMIGDDWPLPGIRRMPARASRISRPVGMAGRPAYNPSTLVAPWASKAWRTWRSIRQKMSRARQITVIRALMRRLFFRDVEGGQERDTGGAVPSGYLAAPSKGQN
jgi:hypothetical protein